MIIYEVNSVIQPDIYDEYVDWLYTHIKEILTLNGFASAKLLHEITAESQYSDEHHCTVCYELDSAEALNAYLADYADSMNNEAIIRFGDQFNITERVFEVATEMINHSS